MEDTLVIIPAHNEESTIELVVKDLRSNGYYNILVVDDNEKLEGVLHIHNLVEAGIK